MSQTTKLHHYPYTLKVAGATGLAMCNDKLIFFLVPPKRGLTIENMHMHLKATFDASVAVGNRIIKHVAIGNEKPLFITDEPSYYRKLDLDLAADANRQVDLDINLTPLLNREHAGFRDLFDDSEDGNLTYIYIKLSDNLRNTSGIGTVTLWRVDALYTTQAIR